MATKLILLICCALRIDIPEKFVNFIFSKDLIQKTAQELQIYASHEEATYYGLMQNFYETFFLPPIQNSYIFHDCAGVYDTTFYFQVNCKLARNQKEYLIKLGSQSIYDAVIVSPYLLEINILYDIHNTLDDATRKTFLMTRRRALNRLIDLLGEKSYLEGKIPPPIPIWRYKLYNGLDFENPP